MHHKQHTECYNYLFIMIVFLAMLGALVGCTVVIKYPANFYCNISGLTKDDIHDLQLSDSDLIKMKRK